MGNHVAKEFQSIDIASQGSSSLDERTTRKTESFIAPRSLVLDKPTKVLIKRDDHRKTAIVFDRSTMLPMFITSFPKNHKKIRHEQAGRVESITKDARGRVLFLTTSVGKERCIYKATQDMSDSSEWSSRHEEADVSESHHGSSTDLAFTTTGLENDMPCAAKIVMDNSGPVGSAFLNAVVWNGSGPDFMTVYKAVKVPGLKFGTLVVDMKNRVVAKSRTDEKRRQPMVELARGADILAALALISALHGNF